MKQTFKNNLIKALAGGWALLAALDTKNVIELIPEDFEYAGWVKFAVPFLLIVFGMFGYKKPETIE